MNTKQNKTILLVIAGTNGAGKSSLYEIIKNNISPYNKMNFINPDIIAKQLSLKYGVQSINDLPEKERSLVNLQAGREALKQRELLLSKKQSFGIETTASSSSILKLINSAHDNGYFVDVMYVMLENVNFHIHRVNQRASKGGHFVPSNDIKRRYERALNILPTIIDKADRITIYDNTVNINLIFQKVRKQIFNKVRDKFTFYNQDKDLNSVKIVKDAVNLIERSKKKDVDENEK